MSTRAESESEIGHQSLKRGSPSPSPRLISSLLKAPEVNWCRCKACRGNNVYRQKLGTQVQSPLGLRKTKVFLKVSVMEGRTKDYYRAQATKAPTTSHDYCCRTRQALDTPSFTQVPDIVAGDLRGIPTVPHSTVTSIRLLVPAKFATQLCSDEDQ